MAETAFKISGVAWTVASFLAPDPVSRFLFASLAAYSFSEAAKERDKRLEAQHDGAQLNVMSNEASIPVIYGQTKVGLKLSDVQQDGTDDKVLAVVGALCVGSEGGAGIEEVSKVYFNDVLAIDAPTAGNATQNGGVQSTWKTGTTFGTDLWVQYGLHYGADAQTHDTELATRLGYTTTDDAAGIAYIALLLYYNEDVWTTGRPRVNALVKGQKVYDPRDLSTAWSDNPALCIRDYMTSVKYGLGIPTSEINDTSFAAAANYCDVLVSIPSASTHKRYTCNGWLDSSASPIGNLRALLSSCRGDIVRIGGEYHLKIRQTTTAETFELNETNIIGDFEFFRGGTDEAPNRMVATFIDPDMGYQPNDTAWPETGAANAYLTADNNYLTTRQIELPFTDDIYRAQQVCQVLLAEGRQDVGVALTATREALKLTHGDVVKLTHPTPGWTDKEFFVVAVGVVGGGNVRVVLREYDSGAYGLSALSTKDTPPGTNLPDPQSCAAPTGLTLTADATTSQVLQDGTTVPRIKVEWTASADPFLAGYRVRMKVTADADSTKRVVARPDKGDVETYLSDVANGTDYTVDIQAFNAIGVNSAWVSDTVTVATTEAKARVDNLRVYLDGAALKVGWEGGTAGSLSYIVQDTEPNLAQTQAGTDTTSTPVTVHTFTAAGLKWVGVLLYTDASNTENESDLVTFPVTYTGAAASLTAGDMFYADATPEQANLAIGSAGTFLRSTGSVPAWSTATVPATATAGDILYGSASNVWSSLALGSAGEVLKVNAGGTQIEWGSAGLSASAAEAITGAWTFRNFQPETDSTYSIGVTGTRFIAGYFDEVYAGTSVTISTGANLVTLSVGAANRLDLGAGDSLYVPSKLSVGTTASSGAVNFSGVLLAATTGSEILCAPSALATNATQGFLWIPSCAGTPTGTPGGGYSGVYPLVYDSTNNKLWVYDGGWIGVGVS